MPEIVEIPVEGISTTPGPIPTLLPFITYVCYTWLAGVSREHPPRELERCAMPGRCIGTVCVGWQTPTASLPSPSHENTIIDPQWHEHTVIYSPVYDWTQWDGEAGAEDAHWSPLCVWTALDIQIHTDTLDTDSDVHPIRDLQWLNS